jgi:small conductance mechanosensitive channel
MTHLSLPQGDLGGWLQPDTLVGALIYFALACALAAILSRALRIAIQTWISHASAEHVDRTAANFLRQLGVLVIWVFVLTLYAHLIPPLRALGTAMLTGASVASIVLGLAAQSTLGNLVAGISILIYRPFRVGDLLQISAPTGTEIGTVQTLSLGYTILATQDGRRVIVPNSLVITQTAVNLNAFARGVVPVVNFWVARADLVRARVLAIDFARALGGESSGCFVVSSDTGAVQLSLSLRPAPAEWRPTAQQDAQSAPSLPAQLAKVLQDHGIGTPVGKSGPTLASS